MCHAAAIHKKVNGTVKKPTLCSTVNHVVKQVRGLVVHMRLCSMLAITMALSLGIYKQRCVPHRLRCRGGVTS